MRQWQGYVTCPEWRAPNPGLAACLRLRAGKANTASDHVLFQLRFSSGLLYAAKLYYCGSTRLKAATQAAVGHWCALVFPNTVFGKKKLLETELKEELCWSRREKTVSYGRFQTDSLSVDFSGQSLADPPPVSRHKTRRGDTGHPHAPGDRSAS